MSFGSDFSAGASVGFGIKDRILAKKLKELEDQRYNENRDYSRGRDALHDSRYAADKTYQGIRDTAGDNRWDKEFGQRVKTDAEIAADRREARIQRGQEFARSVYSSQMSDDMKYLRDMPMRRLNQQKVAAEIERHKQPNPMAGGYEQSTTYDDAENPIIRRVPIQPGATAVAGRMGQMPAGIQQQYQQSVGAAPRTQVSPQQAAQAGKTLRQNGKLYRFDGQNWNEVK